MFFGSAAVKKWGDAVMNPILKQLREGAFLAASLVSAVVLSLVSGKGVDKRTKKILALSVAAGIIFVSWLFILWTQIPRLPPKKPETHSALGRLMAEQTIKCLQNKGEIVILAYDISRMHVPKLEAQKKTFLRTLEASRIKVRRTVFIPPLQGEAPDIEGGFPGQIFLDAVKDHPQMAAIVSFAGMPRLRNLQVDASVAAGPKLIVYTANDPDLRMALEDEVVDLAIVPRGSVLGNEPVKDSDKPGEWFERDFQILTKENVNILPVEEEQEIPPTTKPEGPDRRDETHQK